MTTDIQSIIAQMTLEEKAALCTGASGWTTTPVERLGIPEMLVSDGPHGVRRVPDLAGFLYLVRFGNLNTAAAQGMELDSIAAAVVGGVSTNGGKGTVMGTLLGAVMINLLQQSLLRWLVISNFWVEALLGLLILIAVLLDSVIINRLSTLWNQRRFELQADAETKATKEKESHAT